MAFCHCLRRLHAKIVFPLNIAIIGTDCRLDLSDSFLISRATTFLFGTLCHCFLLPLGSEQVGDVYQVVGDNMQSSRRDVVWSLKQIKQSHQELSPTEGSLHSWL